MTLTVSNLIVMAKPVLRSVAQHPGRLPRSVSRFSAPSRTMAVGLPAISSATLGLCQ